MVFASDQSYHHKGHPRRAENDPSDAEQARTLTPELAAAIHPTNPDLLAATGDQELPDITLTQGERELLKKKVRVAEVRLSPHALMYLACSFEDAARRKRVDEEGDKKMRRAT